MRRSYPEALRDAPNKDVQQGSVCHIALRILWKNPLDRSNLKEGPEFWQEKLIDLNGRDFANGVALYKFNC